MGGFRERVHGDTLRQLEHGDDFALGLKQEDDNWKLLIAEASEGTAALGDQREIRISDEDAGWLLRKYENGAE